VGAQVESLPPQVLYESLDPIDLVVIGRRGRRRIRSAEAWPVRRHYVMVVGKRRDLVAPAL